MDGRRILKAGLLTAGLLLSGCAGKGRSGASGGDKPGPTNEPPVADAGQERTITLPAAASLDGTVSDDGLPNPPGTVTTTWSTVSGPGTVTFGDATAIDTTASFSTAGTYLLRLTADDSELQAYDEVTITVNPAVTNQPPAVNTGPDQTISVLPWLPVPLSGAITDDGLPGLPSALACSWSMTSGSGTVTFGDASAPDTTAYFSTAGNYVLRLTADDGQLQAFDEVSVTVNLPVVKIMPLGDSITSSEAGHASYRYWLWHDLVRGGYGVDFVGSEVGVSDGQPLYPDFDQDHEGHWGWSAAEVRLKIGAWASTYRPDVVLIHLGTNDIFLVENIPPTIAALGQIIDELRAANPHVAVLLAQIIPFGGGWLDLVVQAFNAEIPPLAALKDEPHSPVLAVDQWTGFAVMADTYDGIHPNESGEIKMAGKWYAALVGLLSGRG